MKKIQCTFRLPESVVSLIDEQDGETRTDKLLSLLGYENKSMDYGEVQSVIKEEYEARFKALESRIAALESKQQTTSPSSNSANEARKAEAIEKIHAELDTIPESDYDEIRNARYPLSAVRKRTNISKSQCDSYKYIINERLGL
ncbi:hypothetical protein CGJ94_21270 [Vibrio parahaemolyticus]|uniref:hypothetical protein n=1 Tax=Vibrio parahaemolyticus TaxID=670 RepID=UPI00111CF769|nr:hypothetical protein [Vibrio parahaemolyticus]MBE4219038.1 hypothetical protein [Vibrio parahaemolyticus]TOB37167.1 hypothetical protein CGK06_25145 [Vibrio parahaemolyticus]TOC12316.1 hypothetical protein CGJ94_21270 [Vibrio parahaemolyticus]